jgi:hypothetical protein
MSKHEQLPIEIIRSVTFKRILLSIVSTSIVLMLANVAAKLYLKYFPQNEGYWLIDKKWEMLTSLSKPVDWLIFGDSSCNQGVVTSIFEEKLDTSAINLCTIGDTLAVNDAWMLAKYIEKHGAPKNILIVHVYDIWDRNINWNVTAQTPLKIDEFKKLPPNLNPELKDLKTILLDRYLPLYSQNESLKNLVKKPENLGKANIGDLQKGGFMKETKTNPGEVQADLRRHIDYVRRKEFHLSPANQKSLDAIVSMAEKYKINVYITNSPIYEGLDRNKDFLAYFDRLQKTFQELDDRSPQIHYIAQPIAFPKEVMQNADHLVESSAKVYTEKLVEKIQRFGIE